MAETWLPEYSQRQEITVASANIWKSYEAMAVGPHWTRDLEDEFHYKLDLPVGKQFTRGDASIVAEREVNRFHDHKMLFERARTYVADLAAGRDVDPGRVDVIAAHLSSYYYFRYMQLRDGKTKLLFTRPGLLLPQPSYSPDSKASISMTSRRVPFFGDTPLAMPSGYSGEPRWMRGFDSYPSDNARTAKDLILDSLKDRDTVNLMDNAFGDGFFLSEATKTFGSRVQTYGTSIEMVRFEDRPIAHDAITPGELPPLAWEGKIDVSFSNLAYEYFMFPELALREQMRLASPGGTVHVQIGRPHGGVQYLIMDKFFLKQAGQNRSTSEIAEASFHNLKTPRGQVETAQHLAQSIGISVSAHAETDYLHITRES